MWGKKKQQGFRADEVPPPQPIEDSQENSDLVLDGRSLLLPDNIDDEVSSINSSLYHGRPAPPVPEIKPTTTTEASNDDTPPKKQPEEPVQRSCLPLWLARAPQWLKLVLVASVALLVGAIVLVAVGLSLALTGDNETSRSSELQGALQSINPNHVYPTTPVDPAPVKPVDETPVEPEPVDPEPVEDTTTTSTVDSVEAEPEETVPEPTPEEPVVVDTSAPTPSPSAVASNAPSFAYNPDRVQFYVTGGRYSGTDLVEAQAQLPLLPTWNGDALLLHLGDWNSPAETNCSPESYQQVSDLFSASSVPVYFVPGDNELNDCADFEQAQQEWDATLLDYERQFWPNPSWEIYRDDDRGLPENYVFEVNGVVFCGLHLVGGRVRDTAEWNTRLDENLAWIAENYEWYRRRRSNVMVLVVHAAPDVESEQPDVVLNQQGFFNPLFERIQTSYTDMQFVLVHRNFVTQTWDYQDNYRDIPNLSLVTVEGSSWPPMKIQIDPQTEQVMVDQGDWI